MRSQKYGGLAALVACSTYIFGFVLFFGILDTSANNSPEQTLAFLLNNRDTFYLAYIVIGIVFSIALIVLFQSLYARFSAYGSALNRFAAIVAGIWSCMVLSSTFIFLTSLGVLHELHTTSPQDALNVNRSISIIVNALGGGIELIGAIWVFAISYLGLKYKVYLSHLHFLGLLVGAAGLITLFSGLSFLSGNILFETSTAIFGLGQILWFLILGIMMLRDKES